MYNTDVNKTPTLLVLVQRRRLFWRKGGNPTPISRIFSSDLSGKPAWTSSIKKCFHLTVRTCYLTVIVIILKFKTNDVNCSYSLLFIWGQPANIHRDTCLPRLAAVCMLNHRGRQSLRKSLSPAHLSAYRSTVMKRQGDCITTDDVKRKCPNVVEHSDNNTAGLNQLILFLSGVW